MFTEGKDQIVCLGDKREYIALDFVKLVCAFLVMMIHIPITGNGELNFWLTNVPCRLAVPFFFLTAGFFAAGKMHDKAKIVRYIRRIMCLYMIYTIVYARWIIVDYVNAEQMNIHGVQRFIYEFFYAGSYVHLWYLIALVWAVGLLYILLEKFKWQERNVYTIAAVLYAIGVCGNGYRNFSTKIPFINWLYTSWGSTRDGIFFWLSVHCFRIFFVYLQR